jgi:hypothetical protein
MEIPAQPSSHRSYDRDNIGKLMTKAFRESRFTIED